MLKVNRVRHYHSANPKSPTSNARIPHVTTNRTMNPIMYTFQGVAGAAAIARCVVTESVPGIHTHAKVVGTLGQVILH